ncbi:choline dehydrogenase [Aspergillus bombycis]|uniref:Choline dehydrogenase n=1 Tax=Aspergillus bombycis TaxID=109264 RepID=A0A1F7ZSJ9_9EURO|nr:choline dehydrogenase [Aspergillus bombycis]OGM42414.1 choline dehydrogenase [Aspergillus bombycis]
MIFFSHHASLYALWIFSLPLSWVASYGLLQPTLNLLKSTVPTLKGKLSTLVGVVGVESTYDYVIVGGGTAGNTIGSRLAEAGLSVAIVEAGSFYEIESPLKSTIPAGYNLLVGSDPENVNVPVDWGIVTAPQAGANGRRLHYAQGKCLGGSSALNAMIYQRGTTGSYDQWATLVEDDSYKWENILPFFKRSVQFTPPDTSKRFQNATTLFNPDAFDKDSTGPVQVSYINYVSPFATWMKAGMEAMGIPVTEDFNSGHILGTQYNPSTINPIDETRSSSDTFISSLPITSKLHVYPDTLAKRIVFNENKETTGVDVETAGQKYHIRAAREVIVCAGSFHSPQILMVSGIGPGNTLHSLNIPIVSDLPGVGQNMWDHPFFAPSYRVSLETETRMAHDKLHYLEQGVEYAIEHAGTWTNTQELLGWEKLPRSHRMDLSQGTLDDLSRFPSDWPEVEYLPANGFVGNFSDLMGQQPADGYQYASFLGVLIAPTSRGNVTIRSNSTSDRPIVNPNWLTTKTDVEVAVAIYRRMREIWQSEPLQSIVVGNLSYPLHEDQSDEEIIQYIRESLMPIWHPACTCKMGVRSDPMSVVDSHARVYGVDRLRVVDASAFPLLPPGHPQSTVYMLAEKISHGIISHLEKK